MSKPTKLVNGVRVELTPEEIVEFNSRKPPKPEKASVSLEQVVKAIEDLAKHVGYNKPIL